MNRQLVNSNPVAKSSQPIVGQDSYPDKCFDTITGYVECQALPDSDNWLCSLILARAGIFLQTTGHYLDDIISTKASPTQVAQSRNFC